MISNVFGCDDEKKSVFGNLFFGIAWIVGAPIVGAILGGIAAKYIIDGDKDSASEKAKFFTGKKSSSNAVGNMKREILTLTIRIRIIIMMIMIMIMIKILQIYLLIVKITITVTIIVEYI